MKARTLVSLVGSGKLGLMLSASRLVVPCYRVAFLASGLSSGWLKALSSGPQPVLQFGVDPSMVGGLQAWLRLGVALGNWAPDQKVTACVAAWPAS